MTGAVVIGGYVNGLGLVRSLAARGIPTAVVVTQPFDLAHRSRWAREHAAVPDLEERSDGLMELLERRARDWAGWALLPTNDAALAALSEHHERLSSTYRVVSPPTEVARHLLDKRPMLDLARAAGVDLPHCHGPAVEATAAAPGLRFPVVVKPTVPYRFYARFGCKLFLARDREELRRSIARLVEAGIPGDVFDFVPGPDSQIYAYCTYVDAAGEPSEGVLVHKLRQNPPLVGDARVADVARDDGTLREATVEIVRRIGFRGMAIAEFKLDPRDGRHRFLEVNGRSVVYNGLLRRAGLDLAGLAWADHVDGRPERPRPNGWPGVWIHLHPDVLYATLHRRHQRIGLRDFLAPYARTKIEAVWSARDPRPFLSQWGRTARDGAVGLVSGRHGERTADRTRTPVGA